MMRFLRPALILAVACFAMSAAPAQPTRPAERFVPKLEAVAETKLLMEGLNQANFRGLENILKQQPETIEAWTFARGQALLIAETGNLLLLRPPRNQGQDQWQMRAVEMRTSATALAKAISKRDYEGSRISMTQLANSCNRCHQAFQVQTRIAPFAAGEKQP